MTTTTHSPPNLNHAAAALIEALHDVSDMAGLRQGLRNSITYWSAHIVPGNPSHRDAAELVRAWEALDALAQAVLTRKETRHG